jgi:diguanylate cyclase (GGDEF)-like protein
MGAALDRPAPRGAGYVAAAFVLIAGTAAACLGALAHGEVHHRGLTLFLVVAATIAATQAVDLGPDMPFDGAQPIAVLAGALGGPLAGAATGAVSATFYSGSTRSKFFYGSTRALQGTAAGAVVELPGLRYDSTLHALGIGVAAEAAAGAVMVAVAVALWASRIRPLARDVVASTFAASLLAAPFVGGLALADAHSGAGSIVLILVPALIAAAAARIFRERWRTRHAESEARANHDPLTGAFNRRWFDGAIAAEVDGGDGTGLVLLDLDHFKRVNDVYGHAAGDAVLVEAVRRLAAGIRPGDGIVRWGGEEFAVLLRTIGDGADLAARAEELRAAISRRPFVVDAVEIAVTASAGVATLRSDADSLVRAADAALYDAKRSGRDRAVLV